LPSCDGSAPGVSAYRPIIYGEFMDVIYIVLFVGPTRFCGNKNKVTLVISQWFQLTPEMVARLDCEYSGTSVWCVD
jgi:hypothetical protein